MATMGLMVAVFTIPIVGLYLHVTGKDGLDTIEYVTWKSAIVSTVLSCKSMTCHKIHTTCHVSHMLVI